MFKRIYASLLASSVAIGVPAYANDDRYSDDQSSTPSSMSVPMIPSHAEQPACQSCSNGLANESSWKLTGCDSNAACDSMGGCKTLGSGLLGYGLIKSSERCYDDFISPMTNPTYFEDPRQLSEVRFIFINHELPVILGNPAGRIQLYAAQIRVRLTEKLSLIAVKDGYVVSQSPLLD
ncbi:MAG: hypothetical protein ABL921_07600 [Pirellula sp.]